MLSMSLLILVEGSLCKSSTSLGTVFDHRWGSCPYLQVFSWFEVDFYSSPLSSLLEWLVSKRGVHQVRFKRVPPNMIMFHKHTLFPIVEDYNSTCVYNIYFMKNIYLFKFRIILRNTYLICRGD